MNDVFWEDDDVCREDDAVYSNNDDACQEDDDVIWEEIT